MMSTDEPRSGHRGTRAIQRLVEFAPSTGGLALWVQHADRAPGEDTALVATDGLTLYYGAAFSTLPLAEQAGLVAHEVLHIALRHPQRFLELQRLVGDVDLKLFNICADAIVNSALSHLTWLALPRESVFLDRLLATTLGIHEAVEKSLLEWDVERLYRALDDRRAAAAAGQKGERGRQGGASGEKGALRGRSAPNPAQDTKVPTAAVGAGEKSERACALGAASAVDLLPAADTERAPQAEADEALLWTERIERGHAGDGAHSMLRGLLADLPRVQTPWEQVLRTQLAHRLSHRPGLSWSRPSRSYIANQGRTRGGRRLPWEPGLSSSRPVARLVVVVDVSGSIDDALLERFANEIEAITRRLEAGLVLVIGDDRVQKVSAFEPGVSDLREIEFNGRGGTDFTPLLEEADRHRPDVGVVLTDLDGPAHFQPRWPVIWAVTEAHSRAVQPFGRKLTLS